MTTVRNQFGPYTLERQLGRGGMASVHAAVHSRTNRRAAVKIMSKSLSANEYFRECFKTEVEVLYRLRHKNIVRLQANGEQDGRLYYVMELVTGASLQDLRRNGKRFSIAETLEIGIQVCQALKHAHYHGITHRDLKPANLMYDRENRCIKLMDFGISSLFDASQTNTDTVTGTYNYMSPEQSMGKSLQPSTDLYSLGCVFHTLLTGKPPLTDSSTPRLLERLQSERPAPVRQLRDDVPQELSDLIGELLEKNPDRRPATAQAVITRLRKIKRIEKSNRKATADDYASSDTVTRAMPNSTCLHGDIRPNNTNSSFDEINESNEKAKRPSWKTFYTTVAEREFRNKQKEQIELAEHNKVERLKVAGLAAALLAIVAVFAVALWPKSADDLYDEIVTLSTQSEPPSWYPKYMKEFLERFPDDPRVSAVTGLKLDHESEAQFAKYQWRYTNGNPLKPIQESFRMGKLATREKKYWLAAQYFKDVIEAHGDAAHLPTRDKKLVELSRHLVSRLVESVRDDLYSLCGVL